MIYLDYAANTPCDKTVLDCFNSETMRFLGNPNSFHNLGVDASDAITSATDKIKSHLNADDYDVIYTSGATESNNLAVFGAALGGKNKGKHIITTNLEHPSVLAPIAELEARGFEVDYVDIDSRGNVDIDHLQSLLRKDTVLVSVAYVDGEVGTIQNLSEIADVAALHPNCALHTDATQAVGKIKTDFCGINLISFSAHKFYGLNGIGVLLVKSGTKLEPQILGGRGTTLYRSGTPTAALITSTELALSLSLTDLDAKLTHILSLNNRLSEFINHTPNATLNTPKNSSPYIINFSLSTVKAIDFAAELNAHEIYISTKSACCPPDTLSRPVYAVTRDRRRSLSSARISLSHMTTDAEIDSFISAFSAALKTLEAR